MNLGTLYPVLYRLVNDGMHHWDRHRGPQNARVLSPGTKGRRSAENAVR